MQAQINMGLLEKPTIVVPWVDSFVSMARPSMLSIYGVSQGFNYQLFLSLIAFSSGSGQGSMPRGLLRDALEFDVE
jgi:hypothetical protein